MLPSSSTNAGTGGVGRSKLRRFLDSRSLHKAVIALITIDTACVLADLIYTFLSPICTPEGPEAPQWLEVLAHISLVITTLFLIEIPLTLWAFGAEFYNPLGKVTHARFHLFDAAIILTTFVLEVVLKGRERELAGLLIVLRLWRLIKLVGGVAVGTSELAEEELAETREELAQTRAALSDARIENQALKARLTAFEVQP